MNFEELKSEWDKTAEGEVSITANLEKGKKSLLPIETIRSNMKSEFGITLIGTLISAFLPQIFQIRDSFYFPYYCLYFFYSFLAAYYLYVFYNFYFDLKDYSNNTKNTINEVYYEIKLKIETYKTYGYSTSPYIMASISLLILDYFSPKNIDFAEAISKHYQYPLAFFVIGVIWYYLASIGYLKNKYILHLNYIKSIINNLENEDNYLAKKETKNYGFFHALITGKGNKTKSFITMVILVTLLILGYLVGQWLKNNRF